MNNFFTSASLLLSISVLLLLFFRLCWDRRSAFDLTRRTLVSSLVMRGISIIATKERLPEEAKEDDIEHLFGLRLTELCSAMGALRERVDALPPPLYLKHSPLAETITEVTEKIGETLPLFEQLRILVMEKDYASAYMVSGGLGRLYLQLADEFPIIDDPAQESADIIHRLVASWNVWTMPKPTLVF